MDVDRIVEESLKSVCGIDGVTKNMSLKEDCGLDSLSLIAVIVELEERLGVMFDDGDLDPGNLVTVEDLADLVWKSM